MKKHELRKKPLIIRFFTENAYCWLSVICTVGIMMLVYYCYNLFPFGETTILRMDLYHQYGPLFAEFYDRVTNLKSFIYSWNTGLGSPFLGNFFNYLSSPSAIIMLILGHDNMPEAIAGMILVKAALAAGSFTYYLKKSQGKHDFSTAGFGILYAMCGYFVAYYWNVMWIDAMVYFPLVIYGIERIINKRKPSVYIAFLALTLLSNYYMGYMTCIFSVIWFLIYFFSNYSFTSLTPDARYTIDLDGKKKYTVNSKIKSNVFLRSGFTFAFSSLAAGCLVAVSLIPVYICLRSCSATSGTWPQEMRTYFSTFDFLANHLASVDPTIRSSGTDVLPNVFCGLGTLILVPLFLFSRKISLKEKVADVFTLGFLFFSFNINYLNYIWHGFHFPNDLPYRFSFMYSFLLLVMAYKAYTHLYEYTGRQILGAGVAVIFAIIMVEEIGSKNVTDTSVLLSIIFVVTYCLIFYLLKDQKKQKSAISVVLLCCIIAEIACANTDNYSMTQIKGTYTDDYSTFTQLKEKMDKIEGNDDYRMELTYNRARMDPAWFGYNGISTFSSMAYEKVSNMQSDLGLYSNYINSYTYYVQTPIYNMMHSLKYVVDNDPNVYIDDDFFTEVATVDNFTAYKNNYYLSMAMAVPSGMKDWYSAYTNPFTSQGEWFEKATGVKDEVFSMMTFGTVQTYNVNDITTGFDTGDFYYDRTSAEEGEITFVLTVPEEKHCYLFVDSNDFDSIRITKNDRVDYQEIDEPYIYDIGIVNPDDAVSVTITVPEDSNNYGFMNFYPFYVNEDVLNEGYAKLQKNQMEITSFEETCIKGTINAEQKGMVFTSIPYDKGWTVKVDGKELSEDKITALRDAYLCFDIEKGEHDIEISFRQRGLLEGACISIATLLILIVVAILFKKKITPMNEEKYRKACEKAQADHEAEVAELERQRMAALMAEIDFSGEEGNIFEVSLDTQFNEKAEENAAEAEADAETYEAPVAYAEADNIGDNKTYSQEEFYDEPDDESITTGLNEQPGAPEEEEAEVPETSEAAEESKEPEIPEEPEAVEEPQETEAPEDTEE